MGLPSPATRVAAEPMFVMDLDGVFQRLPAVSRAKLLWTKPVIEAALRRLIAAPGDDALLHEVATAVLEPLRLLSRTLMELLAANRDELRVHLMDDLRRQEMRLQAFLPDDDSRDTLEWVLGFLRALFSFVVTFQFPEHFAAIDEQEVLDVSTDAEARNLMRGMVALMAADEAAKAALNADVCADLIDTAFLNLMEFKKAIRSQGYWLSPFPNETSDDRHQKLAVYASRLREMFTIEDWRAIDRSRIGNLR